MYACTQTIELNKPGLKRASGNDNCNDARLKNFATGERILLNEQPYVEFGCPETNIYTNEYKMKPRIYKNYNDIDLGLILYHTDETIMDPYYGPEINLIGKSEIKYFKAPDESCWKVTKHVPKYCQNNYLKCNRKSIDTLTHREDIISDYVSQIDRNRFMIF